MSAVLRQEPKWPVEESPQEFLMRTLSADQWKAISKLVEAEIAPLRKRIEELETDV